MTIYRRRPIITWDRPAENIRTMRKLKLYVTITIDGLLARPGGKGGNWIEGYDEKEEAEEGYRSFCETTDTILMGNKTYQEILRNDMDFPIRNAEKYVFTRNPSVVDGEGIHFVSTDVTGFARKLLSLPGKDIWLLGGVSLFPLFLNEGLVNEIHLVTVPVIAGSGISLFRQTEQESRWRCSDAALLPDGRVRTVYIRQ